MVWNSGLDGFIAFHCNIMHVMQDEAASLGLSKKGPRPYTLNPKSLAMGIRRQ